MNLDSAYVPIELLVDSQTRVTDNNLLTQARQATGPTLVIGEPGCGKSTLLRKVFRDACDQLYANPVANPLPVYIELRDEDWQAIRDRALAPGSALLETVQSRVEEFTTVYRADYVFKSYQGSTGITVILDGLDEVPSGSLSTACAEVRGLYRALVRSSLGSNAVIVSGRHQLLSLLPANFRNYLGQVLQIQPFSLSDVYLFLGRWPFQGSEAPTEIARIFESIRSSTSLQDMCSNPLVLAMYVARDQQDAHQLSEGRKIRLPDNRTDFYREIVDELLVLRREAQSETRTVGADLRTQREEVLGRISLNHLLSDEPANSVPWREAVSTTAEVLRTSDSTSAEQYIRRLGVDTGLHSEERKAESLRFMHLTVCEYIAAKELSERDPEEVRNLLLRITGSGDFSHGHRLYEMAVFTTVLAHRAQRRQLAAAYAADSRTWPLACRVMNEKHDYDGDLLNQMVDHAVSNVHNGVLDMTSLELLLTALARSEVARRTGEVSKLHRSSADDLVLALIPKIRTEQALLLFQAYLQIDPASAIALLSELRDLGDLPPGTMARSLQDPLMVRFAVDRAVFSRKKEQVAYWCTSLSEASLRYRLVADVLRRMSPEPALEQWEPSPTSNDARWGWAYNGPLARTLMGQILAISTKHIKSAARGIRQDVRKTGVLAELGAAEILSDASYPEAIREILNLTEHRGIDPVYREVALIYGKVPWHSLWMQKKTSYTGVLLDESEMHFNQRRITPSENIIDHRVRLRGRKQTGLACLVSSGTALAYLLMQLDEHQLVDSANLVVNKSVAKNHRKQSSRRATRPSELRAAENDPPVRPSTLQQD